VSEERSDSGDEEGSGEGFGMSVVPEEIEHLDFNPEIEEENKEKPRFRHFQHPTIPSLSWCGRPNSRTNYMHACGKKTSDLASCPECKALLDSFGGNFYWETHRRHFGSNCCVQKNIQYHDCV
jgi:hypothetical protein